MLKNVVFAVSTVALIAGAPSLAFAKSSGHTVTPPNRADACEGVASGTDVDVPMTLPNGKSVTITFHCGTDESVAGDDSADDNGQDSPTFRDGVHSGQGNDGQDNSAPGHDGKSDDAPGHDQGHGGGDDGGTD